MRTSSFTRPQRRTTGVAAAVLAGALALTACGGGDAEGEDPSADADGTPAASGEVDPDAIIEAGISYSLSGGFDPMTTSGAVTVAANWHTLEGVTELDPATREVYAALGADLPTQVDATTWQVTLRDGAVFHDGTPVTADDVVYSFERVMDPENNSFYRDFIDFIESVEAVDETTVQFNLGYEFSLVPERLSVVKVVPEALVESDYESFNSLPVGTGPYRLVSATPDDAIVFERFDDYTGPRPAQAAGMNWQLLSDSAARVTAMSSGTVHAIEDVPYIDVPTLQNTPGVELESVQSFGLLFLMFNTDAEPFDDPRVRQAFHYAIDTESIIETGLLGNASAATSFLPETHPNYNEAASVYDYDPDLAKELLAEAGVDSLDITLLTTDTGWVADVAPLIKEDLDAVGISTTLDIGQSGGQYTKVDSGDYEVMVAPGDPSVFGNDPDILMRWWYGDNVWTQTRTAWADTEEYAQLTELMDAAVRTGGEEQQELWNQAIDLMSEQVPLYPLFHRQLPTAWSSDELVGFAPVPLTGLSFLDVGVAAQ
ncbi:ABC transporter substrate-binding protein [Georgenia satyanarayanai]|uniref:ABC transporter substrate-binding protein n=1 Tax=Georgenia satyanarayanai TaxID=860221 RepID=UPI00203F9816|nr:ABC transporter substrate-binding protein [Georgenia satyanarayanai]MCM3660954.1 ABC transporter substrate-binding protein [Georgenia satyanarayanai]